MNNKFKPVMLCSLTVAALIIGACSQNKTAETETLVIPENAVSTITVNISGFESQQGIISAGLYDEAGYASGKAIRGQRGTVDAPVVTLVFQDVPAGEYGIRMFRDVDSDGNMNANAFGIPTEPYAFSNNAKGNMGPAKWAQAKFAALDADTVQSITLK